MDPPTEQKQEVTVIGEVQNSRAHFYRENLARDDDIGLNGAVMASKSSGWFRRCGQVAMKPGDTIVVPLDTEWVPPLPLWQAVTSIVYKLAIAAAAVNAF